MNTIKQQATNRKHKKCLRKTRVTANKTPIVFFFLSGIGLSQIEQLCRSPEDQISNLLCALSLLSKARKTIAMFQSLRPFKLDADESGLAVGERT